MSSTRWLKIWTRLSLEKNQGRSWFSSGLVRLWEAYAFLLRSLAWLVNKSLCFGMICCSMLIPWCESLHAQSWCGASIQAGALHSFRLEAHTDSPARKCLDLMLLTQYAIWDKLNEQHFRNIVDLFCMNKWMNGIRVLWIVSCLLAFGYITVLLLWNKSTKWKYMHKSRIFAVQHENIMIHHGIDVSMGNFKALNKV